MSTAQPTRRPDRGPLRRAVGRVMLAGAARLPAPRDEAAVRVLLALRDLLRARRGLQPRPLTGRALRPGTVRPPRPSIIRTPTGLPSVLPALVPEPATALVAAPALVPASGPTAPDHSEWLLPQGITGAGQRVRTLYRTGRTAPAYDVDLLEELNAQYAERPLVPSPPSYAPDALAEAARRRVGWVHGMVDLRGRRTLEIGCGNGFEVWSLAHNLGCDAYGVDVAQYVPWAQLAGPRTTFACADLAESNPFPRNHFDRVLSFTVWEHVTHPAALLQAAWDVLAPGGLAWIRANLHAGAQASHRYRDIYFPWPHLLFSDDVVKAWDVRHGREPIGLTWVNRLSWLHYEYYADRIGFEVAHRAYTETPIDEEFYTRFEDVLGRYPRADLRRDYLLLVLRKPAGTGVPAPRRRS